MAQLEATTAADTSLVFYVSNRYPVTVAASGLSSGEEIDIEMDIAGSWASVNTVIDFDTPATMMIGPGYYRVNKPVTSSATAIKVDRVIDDVPQLA